MGGVLVRLKPDSRYKERTTAEKKLGVCNGFDYLIDRYGGGTGGKNIHQKCLRER